MRSILKFSLLSLLLLYCIAAKSGRKHGLTATVTKRATDQVTVGKNEYNISIVSWNLAEKTPSKKDCLFLKEYQNEDIVVIGVQECEDVRPRREEGHRSKAWKTLQKISLGKDFTCLAQHRMGGIQIAVYTKKHIKKDVQDLQILDVACGVGNVLTNKGAICVLFRLRDKTVALVNAHLAAHVGKVCK
jgi:hypothetical protein